jgi:hypothetical protein
METVNGQRDGSTTMMALDAVGAVVAEVRRSWGEDGYSIATMETAGAGTAVAEVWHSDGSVFYVGADRWGNTRHADTKTELVDALRTMAQAQR